MVKRARFWSASLLFWLCVTASSQALTITIDSSENPPVVAPGYNAEGQALDIHLNFAPPPGKDLTVVRNTGLPFIQGTFSNVPNGAMVELVHEGVLYSYVAWYYGGDGNDLVLKWRYAGLAHWGLTNYETPIYAGMVYFYRAPTTAPQAGILAGKTIVQVAAGGTHTLVLTSEGRVYAWGSNDYGQLGNNSTTDNYSTAVEVATGEDISALHGRTVVAVAAGAVHSLALCSDGTVVAWGDNSGGVLGDGSHTMRTAPVAVSTAAGVSSLAGKFVVAISAGRMHSLALCSDGTISGWGDNAFGQLGKNQQALSTVPIQPLADGTSALEGRSVVSLTAGDSFTAAICSDGTVAAWGRNSQGQLGDATTTYRHTPRAVNTTEGTSALFGKTVLSLVAGNDHVLALCTDGSVVAWGANGDSQLGDGTQTDRLVPVAVSTAGGGSHLAQKTVVAVSAGFGHSLALCADGTLAAWGENGAGQLGNNSLPDGPAPVAVNTTPGTSVLAGRKVTALPVGSAAQKSMALYHADAPEMVLESAEDGPLIDGTSHVSLGTLPLGGTLTKDFTIRNISGVALKVENMILDGAGAAAFGVDVEAMETTIDAGGSTTFRVRLQPSAAGDYVGTLHIVSNSPGMTSSFDFTISGSGSTQAAWTSAAEIPFTVESLNATGQTIELTLGFAPPPGNSLMLVRNMSNTFIQGTFANLPEGATVQLSHAGVTSSYVAWYHGGDGNDLVLLWPHMGLAAWGSNTRGQLGNNSTTSHSVPVAVNQAGVLLGKTIVQVSRGNLHSLALSSDGLVYAWGNNDQGQLGDGTSDERAEPVAVSTATGISALAGKKAVFISAGASHSLALCSDGTLAAWGLNSSGQLGDASNNSSTVPVAVSMSGALAGKTIIALAAGAWHSMVLCSDGTIAVWGENSQGQLGDGTTASAATPQAVSTAAGTSALHGRTVTAIAAGAYHSMACCADGTVAAWGQNGSGQLGDSTSLQRNSPVAVSTTSGTSALHGKVVTAIAAGSVHSLALCSDGTVAAWGSNNSGQLGDGSLTLRRSPVAVSTTPAGSALAGRTVVSITTGNSHSLAFCSDGTVAAWGANSAGQLGDGTQTAKNTPTAVNTTTGSRLAERVVFSLSSGGFAPFSSAIYAATPPAPSIEHPPGAELIGGAGAAFGSVPLETSQSKTFAVRNTGDLPLVLSTFNVSGADAPAFSVDTSMVDLILTAGLSTPFGIAFSPSRAGNHAAVLQISTNTPAPGSVFMLSLEGKGQVTFQSWASARGLSSDPTADGGANLLHFAFGTTPGHATGALVYSGPSTGGGTLTAVGGPVILAAQDPGAGRPLQAIFVRRTDHLAAGLAYTVEFSSNLVEWQGSSTQPAILADDGTHEVVSVPFPLLPAPSEMRFFRVKVTTLP